ncbi:peptide-methionine (S)-S-oxide reductase MsrA [Tenacibaculum sp. UWU-22]|uniref:peptide-methionine (S)-S-oxide reductase MsrA n=1 Tax=Tenacibaculum sp. UWU-22 TaxID=3234187 RepID=UPI0034DB6A0A
MGENIQIATLGSGCFWCTQAVFQELKGVITVVSGYAGGNTTEKPTYKEVCSGLTGHAEVVQITFDATIISYQDILTIFFTTHDPTSLNRQGADVGTQYRSIIFYHDNNQKEIAKKVIEKLQPYFKTPIVTSIEVYTTFYEAEPYHQNYFKNNPNEQYCNFVINPKISKFRKMYAEKLK